MNGDAERIDRDWYDQSAYFDAGDHIRDFGSRFQRYRVAKVLDLARPATTDRVLDLGCGWGTISFALAPLVREVVGLDFSERAVAGCDRELERQGLSNVVFRVGDAGASGLATGSFDLVVAADLFEHLYPEDSGSVAGEAFRLLRAGGAFAVWTPCRSHLLEVLKNNDIVLRRDVSHVDYKSMPRLKVDAAPEGAPDRSGVPGGEGVLRRVPPACAQLGRAGRGEVDSPAPPSHRCAGKKARVEPPPAAAPAARRP